MGQACVSHFPGRLSTKLMNTFNLPTHYSLVLDDCMQTDTLSSLWYKGSVERVTHL